MHVRVVYHVVLYMFLSCVSCCVVPVFGLYMMLCCAWRPVDNDVLLCMFLGLCMNRILHGVLLSMNLCCAVFRGLCML